MKPPHVDQLREVDGVATANAMLKDGWVLLEIAVLKQGPLYILGKRIVSRSGASAGVVPEVQRKLKNASAMHALPEA